MTTEPSPPSRPASPRVPLRIAGPILIVLAAFAVAVVIYVALRALGLSTDSAEAIAGFSSGAAILLLGLWRRSRLPAVERRYMLTPKNSLVAGIFAAIGLALALRIAVGLVVAIGETLDPSLCRELARLDDDLPTALWQKLLLAVGLVVLAPLGEELVFRGLLLRGLVRKMSFPLAAVVSGVLFAVLHQQYWSLWPLVIGISLFGVVAAFVYRHWGFPSNVVMHAMFNGIAAVVLFTDLGLDAQTDPSDCD